MLGITDPMRFNFAMMREMSNRTRFDSGQCDASVETGPQSKNLTTPRVGTRHPFRWGKETHSPNSICCKQQQGRCKNYSCNLRDRRPPITPTPGSDMTPLPRSLSVK
ncbi:hypothetical protein TNCV_4277881 [Trichonephila clavipes]|nr:hypothetical protein TNCV_4277881 [Trichonephila clavipes]